MLSSCSPRSYFLPLLQRTLHQDRRGKIGTGRGVDTPTALPSWIWLCTVTDCPTRKNKEYQEKKAKRISEHNIGTTQKWTWAPFHRCNAFAVKIFQANNKITTLQHRETSCCSTIAVLLGFLRHHTKDQMFFRLCGQSQVDWGSPRNMTWDTFYGKTFLLHFRQSIDFQVRTD